MSSNTAIRYFRHAVSLDERRAKFKANLYNRPTDEENKLGVQPGEMPKPQAQTAAAAAAVKQATFAAQMHKMYDSVSGSLKWKAKPDHDGEDDWKHDRSDYAASGATKKETDVLEVWFSGCHCGRLRLSYSGALKY